MMTIPLIPRKTLFGNPDRASVQLSPDGEQIAWLAPRDGVLNVWVAARVQPAAACPVTQDTGRGIRFYTWAYTNRHILYIQDKNGDENWRVYRVDLESGEILDLTPFESVQARVKEVSHKHPDEILVGINQRDPQFHDLYRILLHSGERMLMVENPGFLDFITDDDHRLRGAIRMTQDGGMEMLKPAAGGGWSTFDVIPPEDVLTTNFAGWDKDNRALYILDSRGRDKAALYRQDFDSNEKTLLCEDAQSDAQDVLLHPTEKKVQAVSFVYDRKNWKLLDPAIQPDLEALRGIADGEVEVVSRSLDDRYWIVLFLMDNGPARFYLYNRAQREAEFLFTNRAELEGQPLVKMHSAVIRSRDGLELVAYYSLPLESDPDGDGLPEHPLPMAFVPHGGPWGRDYWGYNPWHQWLSNRGYAVLMVNFRSSTGIGKAFANAGDFEWGGKIMEDQIDAVEWAIAKGIADRDKVGVMGGSFGGYSTLAGLTFTPEVFACGVDLVGPSNLITLLESIPPYWKPMFELFATRVGDPRTEAGRTLLTKHSPLTYVERICRPLLIGQGANDPRVKQAESDQIVQAMQAKGIPVAYVLYPDEGHGFARPENNLSFYAIAEAFLAKHLGGRYQLIGSDFQDSSLQVLQGVSEVPGLPEAWVEFTQKKAKSG